MSYNPKINKKDNYKKSEKFNRKYSTYGDIDLEKPEHKYEKFQGKGYVPQNCSIIGICEQKFITENNRLRVEIKKSKACVNENAIMYILQIYDNTYSPLRETDINSKYAATKGLMFGFDIRGNLKNNKYNEIDYFLNQVNYFLQTGLDTYIILERHLSYDSNYAKSLKDCKKYNNMVIILSYYYPEVNPRRRPIYYNKFVRMTFTRYITNNSIQNNIELYDNYRINFKKYITLTVNDFYKLMQLLSSMKFIE